MAHQEDVALLGGLDDATANVMDELLQLSQLGLHAVVLQRQLLFELQQQRAHPWACERCTDVLSVNAFAEAGRKRSQRGRPLASQLAPAE